MTNELDRRVGELEGGFERIVVILEGEPIKDISGRIIRTEGGLVEQGKRHAEGLNIISHQLDGIQTQLLPRRWTRNQRIKVFGIAATALVSSLSVIVWGF